MRELDPEAGPCPQTPEAALALRRPACAVDSVVSPESPCKLTSENGVDKGRWEADYQFEHCSRATRYTRGEGRECDSPNTSCHWYCEALDDTGDWSARRRPSDRAESSDTSWWWCGWWSGYEWHNGRCHDSTRYLGEECWDDSGECFNEGVAQYDGLHLSCATAEAAGIVGAPRCIPSAFKLEDRTTQCECNWFDWHFGVACGANQCNGHTCVWSTGSGNYTCDWQTDNNW